MPPQVPRWREILVRVLATALTMFVLVEVNYPQLSPQTQLALFALFGLVLCFLFFPLGNSAAARLVDAVLLLSAVSICLYVVVQTEPTFSAWWARGSTLGDRAGAETRLDYAIGVMGVVVLLEATRRCLGWALPALSVLFLLYAAFGSHLPGFLFPHRGYPLERIVAQTFLHSQGVFGIALSVMFTYVFLFVLLGALLDATGATGFIVHFSQRLFHRSPGGAAKVAVLASGLMGSISGSAVANAATTGTFTIPLMRSIGFRPEIAAGITAAASSGGALVPPVMGAGAYMMLELVSPPVTYLTVIRAALIPAIIYYLALFLIVHFYAKRIGIGEMGIPAAAEGAGSAYRGMVFLLTLGSLVFFLLVGYTAFRSVSLSLAVVLLLGLAAPRERLNGKAIIESFVRTARGGVPLIAASASVGIILGVVTLTGIGTKFPQEVLELSGQNLLLALALVMVGSIVLGMGLPSAVCYLLMATLIGPTLGQLGVIPLAAHFFIFYFGMMSMVTPPVALAAYTSASIAGCDIMRSSFAAFRFSLVGFTLPYMFVFRPELLLLGENDSLDLLAACLATAVVILGIVPLAAGIAGYLTKRLTVGGRATLLGAAALLFFPGRDLTIAHVSISFANVAGLLLLAGFYTYQKTRRSS